MPQAKTLSDRELRIVLAALSVRRHSERNRAMLLFSVWAGMRVGEIASLRCGDVLAADGTVKQQINLSAAQTKGNRGRTVTLGDKLRREVGAYIRSRATCPPSTPLFYSQQGRNGFSANSLCQLFRSFYQLAGIDGATSHSGRRTYLTNLANKGVGVRVLMALAGHKNMSTTQRYLDLNDDMLVSAANLV